MQWWFIICLFYLQKSDPVIEKIYDSSEEAKKVSRNKGDKFLAVYERIDDPFFSQTDIDFQDT